MIMAHRTLIALLSILPSLAVACEPDAAIEVHEVKVSRAEVTTEAVDLSHPVLRFDEIQVPAGCIVANLEGTVETLVDGAGWVSLELGAKVLDGLRIRVAPKASLRVEFSGSGEVKINPVPEERYFIMRVGNDT